MTTVIFENLTEDQLMHYGRKGMKWYQHIFTKLNGESKNKKSSDSEEDDVNKRTKKPVHKMSDNELRDAIFRLRMEKDYKDLMKAVNPPPSKRGRKFVSDVLEKSGKNISEQFVAYELGTLVNKLAKQMGSDEDIVDPKLIQKMKKK